MNEIEEITKGSQNEQLFNILEKFESTRGAFGNQGQIFLRDRDILSSLIYMKLILQVRSCYPTFIEGKVRCEEVRTLALRMTLRVK